MSGAWRRYVGCFAHPRRLLAWAALAALARIFTLVPIPLLVEGTLSRARGGSPVADLLIPGVAMLLLQAAGGALHLWSRGRILAAVREVTVELRDAGLRKLLSLGPQRAEALGSPTLHDRVVHETERIDGAARVLLVDLVPGGAAAAGLALALLALDARLLLGLAALAPPFLLSERRLAPALGEAAFRRNRAYQAFSQSVLRGLRALGLVHAQGAGPWLLDRQRVDLHALTAATARAIGLGERSRGLQQALIGLGSVVMLVAGALWVSRGELSFEELAGFFAGLALIRGPAVAVLASAPPVAEADASLRALFELLDEPDGPAGGRIQLETFDGSVELRAASFAWGARLVLADVDLAVAAGQRVVVVGPIGAGKSTLLRLLGGLLTPTSGRALAAGHDLAALDSTHLRRRVGYVPQDPVLLPGTLRDNVAFGRPDATAEGLAECVRLAGLEAWLDALPGGLDAPVGEEGARLSGGQRQQVALARALLGRPALLLLDEPTNHLSRVAARALMERLGALPWRPAIVLATHDLEVAEHAHVVLRLEAGRVGS
ncbi:MAG: ABC transporter ATP-binding protein/permease [Vicinamibacteria bacterium]|nr:ABC transporter ATP-binding protein/permease [Vicinamibacteria bacterium]